MQVINEETFEERYPKFGIDISEMDKDAKDYYFSTYSLYMDLLYQYIIKNTNILKYENMLKEHGVNPVINSKKSFYQKCTR